MTHPRKLVEIWNKNRGILPEVKQLTEKRKVTIKQRLKENPDLAYWEDVFKRIAASNFCCGDNQRSWTACFDFATRRDTHVKVMEGKYTQDFGRQQQLEDKKRQDSENTLRKLCLGENA